MIKNNNSPFITKKVNCPLCFNQRVQKYFKAKSFLPGPAESDGYIKTFKWLDQKFQNIKPTYYFLWHCTNCGFTENQKEYIDPENKKQFELLKSKFRGITPEKRQVIDTLRGNVDYEEIDYESALNLHLLAIYIQELIEDEKDINHLKLGRLYLRTAWLFRENSASMVKSKKETIENLNESEMWTLLEIEKTIKKVESKITEVFNTYNELNVNVKRRMAEISMPEDISNKANIYPIALNKGIQGIEDIKNSLELLKNAKIKDENGDILEGSSQKEYFGYPSYIDFLKEISLKWSEIPLNERSCLNKAAKNYIYSYEFEGTFTSIEQRLNVIKLINDLFIRLEEYNEALKYVTQIYKVGMDYKRKLAQQLSKKRLPDNDERKIRAVYDRITNMVEFATERRRMILGKRLEEYKTKLLKFCKNKNITTALEYEKTMIKAQFPKDIIESLIKKFK